MFCFAFVLTHLIKIKLWWKLLTKPKTEKNKQNNKEVTERKSVLCVQLLQRVMLSHFNFHWFVPLPPLHQKSNACHSKKLLARPPPPSPSQKWRNLVAKISKNYFFFSHNCAPRNTSLGPKESPKNNVLSILCIFKPKSSSELLKPVNLFKKGKIRQIFRFQNRKIGRYWPEIGRYLAGRSGLSQILIKKFLVIKAKIDDFIPKLRPPTVLQHWGGDHKMFVIRIII